MDDKEEQSEEVRAVRVGQKKMMTPTFSVAILAQERCLSQARVSLFV